ncbi:hypothetical protein HWQ46_03350 [Shewanella sp. D64]|uniref:tetratricopeptide repeat protein n=1 Tax=unclassified Shewanella TaxID=196818 RepID=UPI0022BA13D5|nr:MULTISPECIES: tetratricopeptide repeat protein [unclassified Shewanella]MEC4724582.1 hypothetical protein [Shewanella sp. D64]WBJ94687.1 hypothetical protein HWQ47_22990 [Shewanella sp. MTB7]
MLRLCILMFFGFSPVLLAMGKVESKSNGSCIACHQQQAKHWQTSDHAKAMAVATSEAVLGDFSDTHARHHGQKVRFYRKGKQFFADVSYDKSDKHPGKSIQTFEVKYSFGHYPLQQYLVDTGKGKLHVLPFAWDSRPNSEGGQRWYHNYQNEEIPPNDRLHWRQPLQNWNGMCADCHSDGLERNYSLSKQSFNTQWDNINVGCLSCHGDMSDHASTYASNKKVSATTGKQELTDNPMIRKDKGMWQRLPGAKMASWQGEPRDNQFMETCYACHSLRSPLTDGISPSDKFLDQFSPQLINAPVYHVDGQIKEEVYVYGSFMQSKMYSAGVNCLDCHDSHTMKLKAQGNGLCLQCHSPEHFNTSNHLNHQAGTLGSNCVDCHMPQTRYMGVDDRRDHSFSIPRPALSQSLGTPNACNRCHQDETASWASGKVKQWFGGDMQLEPNRKSLMNLRAGKPVTAVQHKNIIDDATIEAISRASALQLLPITHTQVSPDWFSSLAGSPEPLIRLAAAELGYLLPQDDRVRELTPLLNDPLRAVRVAAARTLRTDSKAKANQELTRANEVSAWRGEGRLNLGLQLLATGRWQEAEKHLSASIITDPYFEPSYVNLADIYRATGQAVKAKAVFENGLEHNPQSADLNYGFGLQLIRSKDYLAAERYLAQAAELAPPNVQYQYVYLVALDHNGRTTDALNYLKQYLTIYPASPQLVEIGIGLARKTGNIKMLNQLQQYR